MNPFDQTPGKPQPVETDQVSIYFTNGSGTIYRLDNIHSNGFLGMPPRDQALATALLELSKTNVSKAQEL